MPDQLCDYGPSCCGPAYIGNVMICQAGYWQIVANGCDCAEAVCGP
jgi:hypothetical protein